MAEFIRGFFQPLDNSSPPDRPEAGLPPYVSGGPIVPPAPPIIWPPPPAGEVTPPIALPPPPHISGGPVPGGGRPDAGLPPGGGRPDQGLPPGGVIDNTLPIPPGVIYPPPGPGAAGKFLALVVVAVGSTGQITYAWTVVDPSLTVGWPLPGGPPPVAGQPLPPTPEPKR